MLKTITRTALIALIVCVTSFNASANEYTDSAKALINSKIKKWLETPVVIDAVKTQNEVHTSISQEDINALDQKWRAGDTHLIETVMSNELSSYLAKIKEDSEGLYTEIFVIDNKGLNVGQSDLTTDYWQGDEAKWQETFSAGIDAMHITDVEEDESSQTYQIQISIPVVDNGNVIGTVTVGVNAGVLE